MAYNDTGVTNTYNLGDEEIKVHLDRGDFGDIKSTVDYRYGETTGKGYIATFRRLVEAHGSLGSGNLDDGSLLVISINPVTDSPKRRFKNFSVTLSLKPDDNGDHNEEPSITAFEPAADGDLYFQEKITSVTETACLETGIGVHAPAVEYSLKGNKATENKYERRRLLTLSTHSSGINKGTDTNVEFSLEPTYEEDGIGDRFAVALIVKRSPGTAFFINVVTKADVNLLARDLSWRSGGRRQTSLRLGPFGPVSTGGQTNPKPAGVDTARLQTASDQVLKNLTYLHLPEKGTEKLFLGAKAPHGNKMDHDTCQKLAEGALVRDSTSNDSERASLPGSPTEAVQESRSYLDVKIPRNTAGILPQPALSGDVSPLPQAAGVGSGPTFPDHAPDRGGGTQQHGRSLFAIQNSRAARHRLMASLYQSLAQLHLAEADEVEDLLEASHTDQAIAHIVSL